MDSSSLIMSLDPLLCSFLKKNKQSFERVTLDQKGYPSSVSYGIKCTKHIFD